MGRHKCEAVACVSGQLKCIFFLLNRYIVHFTMANKIAYAMMNMNFLFKFSLVSSAACMVDILLTINRLETLKHMQNERCKKFHRRDVDSDATLSGGRG